MTMGDQARQGSPVLNMGSDHLRLNLTAGGGKRDGGN